MTRIALFLALIASVALAQPQRASGDVAAERYHAGARAYVDGDLARAKTAVEAGLRAAPDNARLQALRDLLEQEQEEQDNQQGGGDDEQSQNQSGGESQEGDEGESGQNQGQPTPDESEAEQDQTRTQPQDPGQASPGGAQPEGQEAGEMSRAQAERILDAVGGDERLLLRELRRAPTRGRRTDKDW